MQRRGLAGAVGLLFLLTACGVANAERERAEVLYETCRSTIARNGLPEPTPALISPELFAFERGRILDRGEDTTKPYRNVCKAVEQELRAQLRAREQQVQAQEKVQPQEQAHDAESQQSDGEP